MNFKTIHCLLGRKAGSWQTRCCLQRHTSLWADVQSNTLASVNQALAKKVLRFALGRVGFWFLLSDQFSHAFAHERRKRFKQPQDPNERIQWRSLGMGRYLTGKPASLRDLAVPPEAIKPRPRALRLFANSTRLVLSETLSKAIRREAHRYFGFQRGREKENSRMKEQKPA